MKKVKQILALMLVVVMTLGMMVFTTASAKNLVDYPDADSIEYKEAVDVLTALGVLVGDDNGQFGPQLNFTREQAAKVMTYICIGTTAADRLGHSTTSFSDVATDRWSNPYIEYCVNAGIIVGYGDGRFGPTDPITASQLTKMLLIAIGYGAKGEFTGERWELNAIVWGQNKDILTIDADYTAPATREQMAEYVFNALTEPNLVTYNSALDDYYEGNSIWGTTSLVQNLGQKTFELTADPSRDGYGFGGREWMVKNITYITGYYQTDKILGTSTNGTPIDTLNRNSRSLTAKGRAGFVAEIGGNSRVVTNNGVSTQYTWSLDGSGSYEDAIPVFVNGFNYQDTNCRVNSLTEVLRLAATSGVIVNLVDSKPYDGKVDTIVMIAKTVHEAGAAPIIASNGNVTITGVRDANLQYKTTDDKDTGLNNAYYSAASARVTMPTDGSALTEDIVSVRADTVEYPADIVKGDVLLVHEALVDGVLTTIVEKAKSIEGKMTDARFASPSNITFGGTTYAQSGLAARALFTDGVLNSVWTDDDDNEFATKNANFDADAIIFLDDNGTVVRARRSEASSTTWGLITGAALTNALNGGMNVRLTTSEGDTATYPVVLRTNQTFAGVAAALGVADYYNGLTNTAELVSYSINDDGYVAITFPGGTTNGGVGGMGSTVAKTAVQAPSTNGDAMTYTAKSNSITLAAATRYITGSTTLFYYNADNNLDDIGTAPAYHSSTNPVSARIGASNATQGTNSADANSTPDTAVGESLNIKYVLATDADGVVTGNVAAIWFDMRDRNAGNEKYAFVTNLGATSSGVTGGTRWWSYPVFSTDGTVTSLSSEESSTFSTTGSGTYGLGLYKYTLNTSNGRLSGVEATEGVYENATANSPAQITYADSGIIRYQTSAGGARTPITVDSATKFYLVSVATNRQSAEVNSYGNSYLTYKGTEPNVEYYLMGVQPGKTTGDAAIAVYIEERTVGTTVTATGSSNLIDWLPASTGITRVDATTSVLFRGEYFYNAVTGNITYLNTAGTLTTTNVTNTDLRTFLAAFDIWGDNSFTINTAGAVTSISGSWLNANDILTASIVADTLTVTAIGGDIYLNGSTAKNVTVAATGGDVALPTMTGNLTVSSGSNDVYAAGNISGTITVNASFTGTLDLQSFDTGAITINGACTLDGGVTTGAVKLGAIAGTVDVSGFTGTGAISTSANGGAGARIDAATKTITVNNTGWTVNGGATLNVGANVSLGTTAIGTLNVTAAATVTPTGAVTVGTLNVNANTTIGGSAVLTVGAANIATNITLTLSDAAHSFTGAIAGDANAAFVTNGTTVTGTGTTSTNFYAYAATNNGALLADLSAAANTYRWVDTNTVAGAYAWVAIA